MKKYNVLIEEKLCKSTEIEAENIEEAMEKAKAMYHNNEIVLDSSDFGTDPEMMAIEIKEDGTEGESTDWSEF